MVLLGQKNIPSQKHRYYLKWLRYYLDFCHKYGFEKENTASLAAFIEKLVEKGQGQDLRKQAYHAVSVFHEMNGFPERVSSDGRSTALKSNEKYGKTNNYQLTNKQRIFLQVLNNPDDKEISRKVQPVSGKRHAGSNRSDWSRVFDEMTNSIKMRHSSPKTLKNYLAWTRKFQAYVKSKDPAFVVIDDVKAFLTWLAEDRHDGAYYS